MTYTMCVRSKNYPQLSDRAMALAPPIVWMGQRALALVFREFTFRGKV